MLSRHLSAHVRLALAAVSTSERRSAYAERLQDLARDVSLSALTSYVLQQRVSLVVPERLEELGLPKIARALDQVKPEIAVHVHSHGLLYVDHACIELIEGWAEQREQKGQQVHIEMEKLHLRYRSRVSESVS